MTTTAYPHCRQLPLNAGALDDALDEIKKRRAKMRAMLAHIGTLNEAAEAIETCWPEIPYATREALAKLYRSIDEILSKPLVEETERSWFKRLVTLALDRLHSEDQTRISTVLVRFQTAMAHALLAEWKRSAEEWQKAMTPEFVQSGNLTREDIAADRHTVFTREEFLQRFG